MWTAWCEIHPPSYSSMPSIFHLYRTHQMCDSYQICFDMKSIWLNTNQAMLCTLRSINFILWHPRDSINTTTKNDIYWTFCKKGNSLHGSKYSVFKSNLSWQLEENVRLTDQSGRVHICIWTTSPISMLFKIRFHVRQSFLKIIFMSILISWVGKESYLVGRKIV